MEEGRTNNQVSPDSAGHVTNSVYHDVGFVDLIFSQPVQIIDMLCFMHFNKLLVFFCIGFAAVTSTVYAVPLSKV